MWKEIKQGGFHTGSKMMVLGVVEWQSVENTEVVGASNCYPSHCAPDAMHWHFTLHCQSHSPSRV